MTGRRICRVQFARRRLRGRNRWWVGQRIRTDSRNRSYRPGDNQHRRTTFSSRDPFLRFHPTERMLRLHFSTSDEATLSIMRQKSEVGAERFAQTTSGDEPDRQKSCNEGGISPFNLRKRVAIDDESRSVPRIKSWEKWHGRKKKRPGAGCVAGTTGWPQR